LAPVHDPDANTLYPPPLSLLASALVRVVRRVDAVLLEPAEAVLDKRLAELMVTAVTVLFLAAELIIILVVADVVVVCVAVSWVVDMRVCTVRICLTVQLAVF
jgi:hypothetical protein